MATGEKQMKSDNTETKKKKRNRKGVKRKDMRGGTKGNGTE